LFKNFSPGYIGWWNDSLESIKSLKIRALMSVNQQCHVKVFSRSVL
jgi:hypothetical protein